MKNLNFLTTATYELAIDEKLKNKIPEFLTNNNSNLSEVKNHVKSREYFQGIAHHESGVGEKVAKKIVNRQTKVIIKLN